MIGLVPTAASAVVNLMTISLAAMNSVIGIYALGQSIVDFKINSEHGTKQSNSTNEEIRRLVVDGGKKYEAKYDDISDDLDWNKVKEDDLKNSGLNFNFNFDKDDSKL